MVKYPVSVTFLVSLTYGTVILRVSPNGGPRPHRLPSRPASAKPPAPKPAPAHNLYYVVPIAIIVFVIGAALRRRR
jgi:hypothetical protein